MEKSKQCIHTHFEYPFLVRFKIQCWILLYTGLVPLKFYLLPQKSKNSDSQVDTV